MLIVITYFIAGDNTIVLGTNIWEGKPTYEDVCLENWHNKETKQQMRDYNISGMGLYLDPIPLGPVLITFLCIHIFDLVLYQCT